MTPEVRAKVLHAVRAGNFREVAAQYAGISYATLKNYYRKKNDPEAAAFLAAILEAETEVEMEMVGAIRRLADGDLKAGTWYLSRKFPQRWAENTKEIREALKLLRQATSAKSND